MTPKQASELLKWVEDRPHRVRRYVLEGGTRRAWRCDSGCGCMTEAHNETEARSNLSRFGMTYPKAGVCGHETITDTGHIMPPIDFS